jgi:hypothetical protein
MKKFNCPSCGAEVVFQSNLSVYAVCSYCRSMIVRHDVDVEAIGVMAALPDDMSPLQIGTTGSYKGQKFGIIGRMKIGWEDGVWNEWFLVMDSGQKGWLAEAQGSYAISFEVDEPLNRNMQEALDQIAASFHGSDKERDAKGREQAADQRLPALGSRVVLKDRNYKIVDIKQATCLGSEGELPLLAPTGRMTLSIDLLGPDGEFGGIEISDGKPRVFLGQYVEWDEMRCQNLRELEGWR